MASDCKASFIVLGESGVGKTSLLLRFTRGTYRETQAITLIDCLHAQLKVKNKKVRLELWDTGGQDRFRTIVRQYYRKADGVLLIYDVTDICTFHRLSSWLEELRSYNEKAVVIIVGNKTDHPDHKQVSLYTVRRFAENEGMDFFETSAKNGDNVYHIFEQLTLKVLEAKGIVTPSQPLSSSVMNNLNNPNSETNDSNIHKSETIDLNISNSGKNDSSKSNEEKYSATQEDGGIVTLTRVEQTQKKKRKCC